MPKTIDQKGSVNKTSLAEFMEYHTSSDERDKVEANEEIELIDNQLIENLKKEKAREKEILANPFGILPDEMLLKIMTELPNQAHVQALRITGKRFKNISSDEKLKQQFGAHTINFDELKHALINSIDAYLTATKKFNFFTNDGGKQIADRMLKFLNANISNEAVILITLAIIFLSATHLLKNNTLKNIMQSNAFNPKKLSYYKEGYFEKNIFYSFKNKLEDHEALQCYIYTNIPLLQSDQQLEEIIYKAAQIIPYDLRGNNPFFIPKILETFCFKDLLDQNSDASKAFNKANICLEEENHRNAVETATASTMMLSAQWC